MSQHLIMRGVIPRIRYISNGALATYSFPFAIFKNSDLKVYFGSELQEASSYSVSGAGESEGGTVTLSNVPASGVVITLIRDLLIERTTDFQEGGALRANTLNNELDYQIACQQQIADNLNRSMVLPPYAADSDVNLTLPSPSAGKAIVWNTEGTNLENSTVAVNALESTLKSYKESAESAANTATTKAGIASDKADIATTQAGIATAKADIATEKAQIATDKATEAVSTLSNKANKDMDNLTAAGKTKVANLAMPSNTYVDLSFISIPIGDYTYTAPKNGYFTFIFVAGVSGSSVSLYINDKLVDAHSSAGHNGGLNCFCKKGDIIKVSITIHGIDNIRGQKFFYAEGEV